MTNNILFVCTHNSVRSVLAEGLLNHWAHRFGKDLRAFSAGCVATQVNRHARAALTNAGVEQGYLRSKSWNDFLAPGAPSMRAVITVCSRAAAEAAPRWPGRPVRIHWDLDDPLDAPDDMVVIAIEQTCQSLSDRVMLLAELPFGELADDELERSLRTIGRD